MAQIGWIDFSTQDRDKVKRIMSLIRPEGQLDELGVGRIRDRLADCLFPGISTIQTRAKYFFIVPYIIRDYISLPPKERKKTKPDVYLENIQHDIKNHLRKKYKGNDNTGIIGITLSDDSKIIRPPSQIYWVGINTFGCMFTQGLSISGYLKNLEHSNLLEPARKKDEEDVSDDIDATYEHHNTILVPSTLPGWKEHVDIKLTNQEADFLKKAFVDKQNLRLNDSVLRELFTNTQLLYVFNLENNFQEFAKKAVLLNNISPKLKEYLILAHDFSFIIDGAHILYNHMIQEKFFADNYQDKFLYDFWQWHNDLKDKLIDFSNFEITSIGGDSDPFFVTWWQQVKDAYVDKEDTFVEMKILLAKREFQVKNRKARLRNYRETNPDMQADKWIGLQQLSYRYGNAKRIIDDIINAE